MKTNFSNVDNIDVVFINPSVGSNYQSLKNKYTSIEPPTWSLLLAESMRKFGFNVSIIDANAENLDYSLVYERLEKLNPKLICFVVYGQNVNAGTSNMEGATKLSNFIKSLVLFFLTVINKVPSLTVSRGLRLNSEQIFFVSSSPSCLGK